MKTDKQTKIVALIAMIVAIGGLSIAFAALSQNLTLDGVAEVGQIGFKVRFENLVEEPLVGDVTINTSPTISANLTHIGDFDVVFATPGSAVSYTATINNVGTIDAIIDSINIPVPLCTGTGDEAITDAAKVCNHISYTLTYSNGDSIEAGDTLDAGMTKDIKLTLSYNDTVTNSDQTANAVTIDNLAITIGYIQA